MKKLLVAATAVAMPVGLIASTAGIAAAKGTPVDVSKASITCSTVTGQAKFAPAMTVGGTESSLSQEGNCGGAGARRIHVPSRVQMPKVGWVRE